MAIGELNGQEEDLQRCLNHQNGALARTCGIVRWTMLCQTMALKREMEIGYRASLKREIGQSCLLVLAPLSSERRRRCLHFVHVREEVWRSEMGVSEWLSLRCLLQVDHQRRCDYRSCCCWRWLFPLVVDAQSLRVGLALVFVQLFLAQAASQGVSLRPVLSSSLPFLQCLS